MGTGWGEGGGGNTRGASNWQPRGSGSWRAGVCRGHEVHGVTYVITGARHHEVYAIMECTSPRLIAGRGESASETSALVCFEYATLRSRHN